MHSLVKSASIREPHRGTLFYLDWAGTPAVPGGMILKDDSIKQTIIECAKAEFLEKGYADASMRSIAEKAGYTTGMLYSRFADKNEIFSAIVDESANRLYDYFVGVQEEFAELPDEVQKSDMHTYVAQKVDRMIDILYDDFDAFKLIVCCSVGSGYEFYIEKMIRVEMKHTVRYIDLLRNMGMEVPEIREDLNHMLASALFYGMFQVVEHDLPKDEAVTYIKTLQVFFNAGWDKIMGFS